MIPQIVVNPPRIVIAGMCGNAGKSFVSLALIGALTARGQTVIPFKKGPDYIDAAWLGRAAGGVGRNLDAFLMRKQAVLQSVGRHEGCDLAVIEGNKGLFDGMTDEGTYSTAALAKLVGAPTLLVLDVTKVTRTAAAAVRGCQVMDPDLLLAGVILNRLGTARQEQLISRVIEKECGIPVLGAVPRQPDGGPSERHLGLVCVGEAERADEQLSRIRQLGAQYLDVEGIVSIARTALPFKIEKMPEREKKPTIGTVGVLRGKAFSFYYPENLEALENAGIRLVDVDPETAPALPPDLNGLLAGGGFPEVYAKSLSANVSFIESLHHRIAEGLPVYAECGGLMYLAKSLRYDDTVYKMAGVLPFEIVQTPRPQGHGYVEADVTYENPFFPIGTTLRGHEFHYSTPQTVTGHVRTAFALRRGVGFQNKKDGVVQGNVFAAYTHLHALGTPEWAPGFAAAVKGFTK